MVATIIALILVWIYLTHSKGDGGGPPTISG